MVCESWVLGGAGLDCMHVRSKCDSTLCTLEICSGLYVIEHCLELVVSQSGLYGYYHIGGAFDVFINYITNNIYIYIYVYYI